MIPQQTGHGDCKEKKGKEKHPQRVAQAGISDGSANYRGALNNGVLNRMLTPVHDERYDLLLSSQMLSLQLYSFCVHELNSSRALNGICLPRLECIKKTLMALLKPTNHTSGALPIERLHIMI